ncbi:MAG: hypothetical protein Q8P67_01160 [archaeon]|nr:hypothetical protein [archaeon]
MSGSCLASKNAKAESSGCGDLVHHRSAPDSGLVIGLPQREMSSRSGGGAAGGRVF